MSKELMQRLDCWVPKPNTLFVSVSTMTRRGLAENVVSTFSSPEDLEQGICTSMAVPFILCDGPCRVWRGQYAVDGGFMNNCPVFQFAPRAVEGQIDYLEDGSHVDADSVDEDRIIVKVDANAIKSMNFWRKILHIAYAPMDFCSDIVLQGTRDMLEILSTEKEQLNGITVISPRRHMKKRDFSYQLFPGKEHIDRFASGKNVIWNGD
eukprot:gnl/TRDRNA2_/TRDRNA2_172882_c0_seq7.p1 gnl/TRDRNA2_/TRDRNA2_172882_c0~~gnl/TRDRNA2_/TRDRNA2_172882_c0_seq7.p1  ORF type:complete len:208 (+),score=22.55 gnl/TRDRNA2_/TRDRNA2_172882_c0_seq7:204-827(+)